MNRVAFTIFGMEIYWYAIMIVSGMLIAMLIAGFLLKKKNYNPDIIIDFALAVLPLSIIGARLYYVLFTLDKGWTFKSIIDIRSGGLAIYGGVIGGGLGVVLVCLIKKFNFKNFLDIADAIIPGLIIAQAIGRWGNFFNQEAYGNLVTSPKLQFFPYAVYIDNRQAWYQATFFYESFLNMIGFVILFMLALRLTGKYKGSILAGYMIIYGLVRVFVEGFRSDSLYFGPFRVSQLFSGILVLAGVICLYLVLVNNGVINKNPLKWKSKSLNNKDSTNE